MQKKMLTRPGRLYRLIPLLLLLGACATGAVSGKVLTMPFIDGASYVGDEACADCHEDVVNGIAFNVHGRLAEFELNGWQKGCESCHGMASKHVESDGDAAMILQPAKLDTTETEAICTSCHTSGNLMEWTFSEHAQFNVTCTDCHVVHGGISPVKADLKKSDPDLCYDCHQEQMAKSNFPSHHPIREGKMSCSDCHNPHGNLQTEEQARDLCLKCHTRYQGPFVFEHAPVEEDCSICHDPHGTVANNLLQQNEPFLCMQCHEAHFHATRVGAVEATPSTIQDDIAFDGTATNPSDLVVGAEPTSENGIPFQNPYGKEGWQRAFMTKCTVCHKPVHGSDLPSQTAPATGWPDGGRGLTR